MSDHRLAKLPRYLCRAAGAYALLGGLVSFAGWATGIDRLADWAGNGIVMKANASLAAAAAGAALLLCASRGRAARHAVRALGVFVATLGGLTLLQHLSGWDFGIDTLLFYEAPGALATASPGRMGPPASTSFLALGTALVLLTGGWRAGRAAVVLGLGVLAIGTLSLTGHWYGAERMYALPRYTGIAAQMATMLVALGLGVIAAAPAHQPMRTLVEPGIAGQLARRLVPLVIVLPLVIGWLEVLGRRHGLYDAAFGAALRSLVALWLFSALVWWAVQAIRERDLNRRRAVADLRASEQAQRQTLESITDGFASVDRDWRFTYVNPATERILGRPRAELLGEIMWRVLPEAIGSPLYAGFHRAMHERVTVEIEAAEAGPGQRYFDNRIYPNADGGLAVYFQDVTERRQAEDALREADRRKDEFLATLAHELRNPLGPIGNAAQILESRAPLDPALAWSTQIIARQVRHMARLLEDLLDVSRISLNRLELRRESVELTAVLRDAAETSRPAIDAAGHALELDLPTEPLHVDGDTVRLTQVFSNLLNNAVKYTAAGGCIRLAARIEGAEIRISVSDNGAGIEPDLLARVFEMFVQGGRDSAQGGLGIGLWLAKGVVERHGGRIEAHSAGAGRGSEFVVQLPRPVDTGAPAPAPASEDLEPAPVRRVLVVDDLVDGADSLAALLRSFGHEVEIAYGGEAALVAAERFAPDAILLDIGMPGIDGFEVCRQVRRTARGREVCIVALTGWGQAQDRERTRDAGFDHHLIKPVDAARLASLLKALPEGVTEA